MPQQRDATPCSLCLNSVMHNASMPRLPPELTRLSNLRTLELRFNNLTCLSGIGALQVIVGLVGEKTC